MLTYSKNSHSAPPAWGVRGAGVHAGQLVLDSPDPWGNVCTSKSGTLGLTSLCNAFAQGPLPSGLRFLRAKELSDSVLQVGLGQPGLPPLSGECLLLHGECETRPRLAGQDCSPLPARLVGVPHVPTRGRDLPTLDTCPLGAQGFKNLRNNPLLSFSLYSRIENSRAVHRELRRTQALGSGVALPSRPKASLVAPGLRRKDFPDLVPRSLTTAARRFPGQPLGADHLCFQALATTHVSTRRPIRNTCLHIPSVQWQGRAGPRISQKTNKLSLCLGCKRAEQFWSFVFNTLSWRPAAGL